MKFMMLVTGDKDYEAGKPPNPELMTAVAELAEKQAKAGRMVDSGGLLPSSHGARVRVSGGKLTVKDGPFAEAKEVVAGWFMVDVESQERAYEVAAWVSSAPGKDGKPIHEWLQVRQVMEDRAEES